MKQSPKDYGIYYFLGNITSHILHALPLYKELGGTFVVVSNKARREVEAYGVPVINIDNKPYKLTHFSRIIKPVYHYSTIGPELRKTSEFLNQHAKVVIFYELFEFASEVRLIKPKTLFLAHGFMLKSYMTMYPKRLEIIKYYDYMAALGPANKRRLVKEGVDPSKLVDLGIARTDDLADVDGKVTILPLLKEKLVENSAQKIAAYLPTFWGPSSIYSVGKEIIRNFPDDYVLIFRPHPQTPKKLLREYLDIIKTKPSVLYAPEGKYSELSLIEVFKASSIIIGDVSSVMAEALLVKKPLVFVYDNGANRQDKSYYSVIQDVVNHSQSIGHNNVTNTTAIIKTALENGIDSAVWHRTITETFFSPNGDSAKEIGRFTLDLLRE